MRLAALMVVIVALAALVWRAFPGNPARNDAATSRPTGGGERTHGVPPPLDPTDVYAADRPGMLSPVVRRFPSRVYVPNSESNTVSVIDPHTYKVIGQFPVGTLPQHVVPSYDLKTLWVNKR